MHDLDFAGGCPSRLGNGLPGAGQYNACPDLGGLFSLVGKRECHSFDFAPGRQETPGTNRLLVPGRVDSGIILRIRLCLDHRRAHSRKLGSREIIIFRAAGRLRPVDPGLFAAFWPGLCCVAGAGRNG